MEDDERVVGSLNATLAAKMASKYDKNLELAIREWLASALGKEEMKDESKGLDVLLHDGTDLCKYVFYCRISLFLIDGCISRFEIYTNN
jgi:hypothetical protein